MDASLTKNSATPSYGKALSILTTLFFLFGFLTCLNNILIPHLQSVFSLNYMQSMLVQFAFFTAFFVVSLPAGNIVKKIGYQKGIILGLATAGLGCLMFYPAAGIKNFNLFLLALFVLAAGVTFLQVAANPYVTALGKPETASSRLSLTQAFNSLGTTLAPLFGSALILSSVISKSAQEIKLLNANELEQYQSLKAASVQLPYLGLAIALFALAVTFMFIKLPVIKEESSSDNVSSNKSIWDYPHLVLGAIGIFTYVGAEVSIGSFLTNYISQPSILGLSTEEAAKYVAFYWGGAMIGRFLGSYVQQKVAPAKTLTISALMAVFMIVLSITNQGSLAMWALILVGFFNSIMFPTIFSLALEKLGGLTSQGSGFLCMAIVGGALVPVMQGYLADQMGLTVSFMLPVFCYVYIAFYGFKGHSIKAN